jgi:hypothetical protein
MAYSIPYHELAVQFAGRGLTRLSDEQGWLLHGALRRDLGEAVLEGYAVGDRAYLVPLPDGRKLRLTRWRDGWAFGVEATASLFG